MQGNQAATYPTAQGLQILLSPMFTVSNAPFSPPQRLYISGKRTAKRPWLSSGKAFPRVPSCVHIADSAGVLPSSAHLPEQALFLRETGPCPTFSPDHLSAEGIQFSLRRPNPTYLNRDTIC